VCCRTIKNNTIGDRGAIARRCVGAQSPVSVGGLTQSPAAKIGLASLRRRLGFRARTFRSGLTGVGFFRTIFMGQQTGRGSKRESKIHSDSCDLSFSRTPPPISLASGLESLAVWPAGHVHGERPRQRKGVSTPTGERGLSSTGHRPLWIGGIGTELGIVECLPPATLGRWGGRHALHGFLWKAISKSTPSKSTPSSFRNVNQAGATPWQSITNRAHPSRFAHDRGAAEQAYRYRGHFTDQQARQTLRIPPPGRHRRQGRKPTVSTTRALLDGPPAARRRKRLTAVPSGNINGTPDDLCHRRRCISLRRDSLHHQRDGERAITRAANFFPIKAM